MLTVVHRVGRVLLTRIRSPVSRNEVTQFAISVGQFNISLGQYVSLVDARNNGVTFDANAEDVFIKVMASNNPLLVHRAILTSPNPSEQLQMQRMVKRAAELSSANNLARTAFFTDPQKMKDWAQANLHTDEAIDLALFLDGK
jgi:hypothetical protein